jgi:hypothetical protein
MEIKRGTWQYFPLDEIQAEKNNFICSPCGTGKTHALSDWIKQNLDKSFIVVTFRVSLAHMLSKTYNFENYLDLKSNPTIELSDHPKVVVSIESLQKFFRRNEFTLPDVLIIDEYCSLLEHSFNPKTLDANRRALFYTFFYTMLNDPKKTVICADAFFSEKLDIDALTMLCESFPEHPKEKYKITINEFRKSTRTIRIWQSAKHWKNYLLMNAKKAEKKIFLFVNNKTVSDAITAELIEMKGKLEVEKSYPASGARECLYLSSDSSQEDIMASSVDPNTEWSKYDFVSVTPTIQAGVSFDVPDHFDMGFGYAGLHSSQPLGILQQLARVRNYTDNIIELCVQKQTKCKPIKQYPCVQEIIDIMETKAHSLSKQIEKCCEIDYSFNVDANILRFGLRPKSVINCFCIRVSRSMYFAKQSLLTAIIALAEMDSYDTQVLSPGECRLISEGTLRDWRISRGIDVDEPQKRKRSELESYETSFGTTLKKHKTFRSELLFDSWNGYFDMNDSTRDASAYKNTKDFIQTWNVLGAFGRLDELIGTDTQPDKLVLEYTTDSDSGIEEEQTVEVDYPIEYFRFTEFSKSNIGAFYEEFISNGKQDNFHTLITNDYKKLMRTSSAELSLGNELGVSDAPVYEFMLKLWHLFGICGAEDFKQSNWLGAKISLHPKLDETTFCWAFVEYDEGILTDVTVAESVRSLLSEYWEHIYFTLVDLKYSAATRDKPVCISTHVCDYKGVDVVVFLKIVSGLLKNSLSFIGLKLNYLTRTNIRPANIWGSGRRVRLYKYGILNFTERLMISFCRLVKDKGLRVSTMIHYPAVDPFRLLQASVVGGYQLYCPIRFRRALWAYNGSPEQVWSDLAKLKSVWMGEDATDAKNKGIVEFKMDYIKLRLPSLENIRSYWNELYVNGDIVTTAIDMQHMHPDLTSTWMRHNMDLETRYLYFTITTLDEEEEWKTTEIFKLTGLKKFDLFCSKDEDIVATIKSRSRGTYGNRRFGDNVLRF